MSLKQNPNNNPSLAVGPGQVTREMYALVKSSTATTSGILQTLQEQTEQMAQLFLDNYSQMESEGHRFISDWLQKTRHHQIELQKAYAQGIDKIAQFIMPALEWEFEFDPPAEEIVEKEEF